MNIEPAGFADFVREMVDAANNNQDLMDGTTAPIKEIIAGADLVLGIWQDATKPYGVNLHVIKGQGHMRDGAYNNVTKRLRCTAIKCIDLEQAVAAQQMFGEVERLH